MKDNKMGTIQLEANIDRPSLQIWESVSAIDAAEHLTNMIVQINVVDSDTRVCTLADGAELTEKIISTDSDAMRVAYTVTDGPFGAEHHNASMQVFSQGETRSRLVWTIDLLPEELATAMREPMEGEFSTIVERLSNPIAS